MVLHMERDVGVTQRRIQNVDSSSTLVDECKVSKMMLSAFSTSQLSALVVG